MQRIVMVSVGNECTSQQDVIRLLLCCFLSLPPLAGSDIRGEDGASEGEDDGTSEGVDSESGGSYGVH
jgi:hypothetical protein